MQALENTARRSWVNTYPLWPKSLHELTLLYFTRSISSEKRDFL
jgi:hypothetical protein